MAEPIDFPSSPTENELYTSPNGDTWQWDGDGWRAATNIVGQGATTVTNILHISGQQAIINEEAINTKTNTWYYGTSQLGWSQTYPGGFNLTAPVGPAHLSSTEAPQNGVYSQYINNFIELPNDYFDYRSSIDGETWSSESNDNIRIKMQMYVMAPSVSNLALNFNLLASNCCALDASVDAPKEGSPAVFAAKPAAILGLSPKAFSTGNSQGPDPEAVVCAEWNVNPKEFLKWPVLEGGWLLSGNCETAQQIAAIDAKIADENKQANSVKATIASAEKELSSILAEIQNLNAEITASGCDCENIVGDECQDLCDQLTALLNQQQKVQTELTAAQEELAEINSKIQELETEKAKIDNVPPSGNLISPSFMIIANAEEGAKTIEQVTIAKWTLRIDYIQAARGYSGSQVYPPSSEGKS
jgi:hypothetical protein